MVQFFMVIIYSIKGEKWFTAINEQLDYVEISKEKCYQGHLEHPTQRPRNRDTFFRELEDNGINHIFQKYVRNDTILRKAIKGIAPLIRRVGLYEVAYRIYERIFDKMPGIK